MSDLTNQPGEKPFYGSAKYMDQAQLDERIAARTRELAELREESKRREGFTDAERLADRLHRLLHITADCDYAYSDWPDARGCRATYRTYAAGMLRDINHDCLEATIAYLERLRFKA